MLLFLFKQAKMCLPRTSTEVIEKFILYTIYMHLKLKKSTVPFKLQKIQDLPNEVFEIVCQLSKIAFDGVMKNKLVFTLEEIKKSCPGIRNGFGLFQEVEHYPETGVAWSEVSVNFIHYNMQEFLAAYHISKLSDKEQYTLMKAGRPENYFCRDFVEGVPATMGMSGSCSLWHSQFTNMWLMYVGLTGGESVAFKNLVHETDSLHGTFTIPVDDRQLLLLFQYYSETNNDTM